MMTVPRWVGRLYRIAAVYGVIVLVPLLFAEPALTRAGRPVSNPESFYGFTCAALVFQWLFWIMGGDPVRYRALMPVSVAEKLAFFVPVALLAAEGRVGTSTLGFACIDLVLGVLFLLAWRATPRVGVGSPYDRK